MTPAEKLTFYEQEAARARQMAEAEPCVGWERVAERMEKTVERLKGDGR